jgi:hypothetical protein
VKKEKLNESSLQISVNIWKIVRHMMEKYANSMDSLLLHCIEYIDIEKQRKLSLLSLLEASMQPRTSPRKKILFEDAYRRSTFVPPPIYYPLALANSQRSPLLSGNCPRSAFFFLLSSREIRELVRVRGYLKLLHWIALSEDESISPLVAELVRRLQGVRCSLLPESGP